MSAIALSPVLLQLERAPGPLRLQIEAALRVQGEPLRWAVTAVQLRPDAPSLLQIEAVVRSAGGY